MSWFDTFGTYGTGFVDLSAAYPTSQPNANARISAYGRRGSGALVLNPFTVIGQPDWIRGVQTATGGRSPYIRMGFAVYLNDGSRFSDNGSAGRQLIALRTAAQHRKSSTANYHEINGVEQSLNNDATWSPAAAPDFQQVTGIVETCIYRHQALLLGVSSDGFLRVLRSNINGQSGPLEPVILRSNKQLAFDSWSHIELSVFMGNGGAADGFVYLWLNGELVGSATGIVLAPEADYAGYLGQSCFGGISDGLLPYPREANGGQFFNADDGGYYDFIIFSSGALRTTIAQDTPTSLDRLDDLYVFADETAEPDQPLGDIVSVALPVVNDGASQDSVIGGTNPAATHWQSVVTNDGDVTRIELENENDVDFYVPTTLTGGVVQAILVQAVAKKSDAGSGAVTLGLTNTDGSLESDPQPVDSSTTYEIYETLFDRDPLNAPWTPATVNDAELRIRRST